MLFCCTKLSVKLFSELHYQDMISVHCNVNNLLPIVAFSKAKLYESFYVNIIREIYISIFLTHLSKTNFAIPSSIPWTGFIPIA